MRLVIHTTVLTVGILVAVVWVACPPILLPVVSGGPSILIELVDRIMKM